MVFSQTPPHANLCSKVTPARSSKAPAGIAMRVCIIIIENFTPPFQEVTSVMFCFTFMFKMTILGHV